MHGDNRDTPVKIVEKTKYHPHIKSMVEAFAKRFPLRAEANVVDIGTRDGYAVEVLRKLGYYVKGTELVDGYVKHAQSMGRHVIFDDIMNSRLPHAGFTHIISRHCIEHCRDAEKFVAQCSVRLKPFGWIFMTLPLETKEEFYAREHPGKNHMVYFPHKNDFRTVANKYFIEEYCGKSKRYDIMTVGRELLYIGHTKGDYDNPHIPGHMLEEELEYLYKTWMLLSGEPLVVEVGSFLGKSSHAIGSGLKKFLNHKFVCVDLFDPSINDRTFKGFEKYPPRQTFENNMKDIEHETLQCDSVEAAKDFFSDSIDLVFVDGNHTYDGVIADINAWWPKIRSGGYMLGHDYKENQFGVKRAVDKVFGSRAKHVCGSIWKVRK